MKNILKYIEILFFIAINLIFASFSIYFVVTAMVSFGLALLVGTKSVEIDDTIKVFLGFIILFFLITLVLKIILFPILYKMKRIFPTIHTFFNKFRDEKKLQITIFSLALLIILLDFFWQFNENDFWYFESLFGFGLIPSYLVMLVFLKLQKQKE